jgi:CubicO group peptidase (beta-lactamase class C family)
LSNSSLATLPGVTDHYSNIGAGILGQSLSLKTGVPLKQLFKDKIWNVLGMNSTGIGFAHGLGNSVCCYRNNRIRIADL